MNVPRTFNLSGFANRLRLQSRHIKLAGLIEKAVNLFSLHSDMMMAAESIKALSALMSTPADPNDHQRLITEQALMNHAIVLYVRATKTRSKIRAGFDLRSRFTKGQKDSHQELCDVRDDAIAHFGVGGSYSGEWQSELAILQVSNRGGEALPAVVARRQTFDRLLIERASDQIDLAREMLRVAYDETLLSVTYEINKVVVADPQFRKELEQHPLNLDVFMKSVNAADAVRASRRPGQIASGSIRHA